MIEQQTTEERHEPHHVQVRINGTEYQFDTDDVTGRDIRQRGGIPDGYSLYRRRHGSNEPIADDERIELRSGDDFFSRPPSNVS